MSRIAATVCLLALAAQPALAGATITIESRGISIVNMHNYELGEGTTAQHYDLRFVATGTGGDVAGTNWGGECYGMAEITANSYADSVFCLNRVSETDSYVARMNFNTDGWDWTIIGGTGTYTGATGTGHITSGWGDTKFGDRLTWTDKGSIILK